MDSENAPRPARDRRIDEGLRSLGTTSDRLRQRCWENETSSRPT